MFKSNFSHVSKLFAAQTIGRLLLAWTILLLQGMAPFLGAAPMIVSLNERASFLCQSPLSPCRLIGGDVILPALQSQSTIAVSFLLQSLGIHFTDSTLFVIFFSVYMGILGFEQLTKWFTRSEKLLSARIFATIFFMAPFVGAQAGMGGLLVGFCMLPYFVALLVCKSDSVFLRRSVIIRFFLILLTGLFLVYSDAYPYVISLSIALLMVTATNLFSSKKKAGLFFWPRVVAGIIPGIIYKIFSQGLAEEKSPMDFYRGQGADLLAIVLPSNTDTLFGKLLPTHLLLSRDNFSGDGLQIPGSYIGLPLMLTLGVLIVLHLSSQTSQHLRFQNTLLIIGLPAIIVFVLGLGPSLKINSRVPPLVDGELLNYERYLLPERLTVLQFPWSVIWEIQPFASMRATFRWEIGALFLFSLLGAILATSLIGNRNSRFHMRLAASCALFMLFLSFPAQPKSLLSWGKEERFKTESAERDLRSLGNLIGSNNSGKTLFLPAGNDYLIDFIASSNKLDVYNTSFDKYQTIVRNSWPQNITIAASSFPDSTAWTGICGAQKDHALSQIVFPLFDLRWNSYSWPPSQDYVHSKLSDVKKFIASSNLDLVMKKNQYYAVVDNLNGCEN